MKHWQNLVLWIGLFGAVVAPAPAALEYYLSPSGNDANAGGVATPFKTPERVRDRIREYRKASGTPAGGVHVWVRGGTYPRTACLDFTAEDSGTVAAPVLWEAWPGEQPRFVGGAELAASWFTIVGSTSAVWSRLDPAARGQVLQIDLKARGVTNFGTPAARGYATTANAPLEFFFLDEPMQTARWPNEGFAKILAVPNGRNGRVFTFEEDRASRWTQAPDPWMCGYWAYLWADDTLPVSALNAAAHAVTLAADPYYGILPDQSFFAFNLLEELDEPGEWYLDRSSGILYFWPPQPLGAGRCIVSLLEDDLLRLTNTSWTTFQGLTFEVCRGELVRVTGGAQVQFNRCTLRNAGTDALTVTNGTGHAIRRCVIEHCGEEGVTVSGGDRASLSAGGHVIENCEIADFGRWCRAGRPGVRLQGVGNRAACNEIHDAPGSGLSHAGNEHLIEYNEIRHVAQELSDNGAIYTGRDWGSRGNVLRYNFIHDIASVQSPWEVHGIYVDDCDSGDTIYGNLLYKVAGIGILVGGGRDVIARNNIIAGSRWAFHLDARGLDRIDQVAGSSWNLLEKIQQLNYAAPPWSTRYPALATILSAGFTEAKKPKGNSFTGNAVSGCETLLHLGPQGGGIADPAPYVDLSNNLTAGDLQFVDEAAFDLNLRSGSPALAVPGFQALPFGQMGIQREVGSPVITRQPAVQNLHQGDNAAFSVAASGVGLSYQWRRNGRTLFGETAATLALASVSWDDEARYSCMISNAVGRIESRSASLNLRPVITLQPVAVTINARQPFSFTVAAIGTPPLAYQWYKDGVAVTHWTGVYPTLVYDDSYPSYQGAYTCVVTNPAGATPSQAGILALNIAPVITAQPVSKTVSAGSEAVFTVVAVGANLKYQWRKNAAAIPGATGASCTIAAVLAGDAGSYSCVVSNAFGSKTSSSASLAVAAANAPVVTTQPVSRTVAPGAPVVFSVGAAGAAPLAYQWMKDGANLPGATGASYSIGAVQSTHAGTYACKVSNGLGSAVSAGAVLAVVDGGKPSITVQPESLSVSVGDPASIRVEAAGTAPLSYQWRRNGVALAGVTGPTCSSPAVQAAHAGTYDCVVSNAYGSVTSNGALLSVTAAGTPPTLTNQSVGQTVSVGGVAQFFVTATGSAPFSYQWRKNGTAIPGATASAWSIASVQLTDAGVYSCVVSNAWGSAVTAGVTLAVTAPPSGTPPSITVQPLAQSVALGASVRLTVAAAGTAPLSYQWKRNGISLAGATQAVLGPYSMLAGYAGSYTCTVSNAYGSVVSAAAAVSVQ